MPDMKRARAHGAAIRVAAGQAGILGAANDVIAVMPLLARFEPRVYAKGATILGADGLPYTAIREVDGKTHPGWTPEGAPSEWRAWHATGAEYALPYLMRNSMDAYMAGEYAVWAGGVYRCEADGTVWNPQERPVSWKRVS